LSVFGQMASAMVGTGGCTPYGLILPSSGPTPSLRIARLRSGRVLEALLYRGELPRGEVASVAGVVERHARRVVSALTDRGVLASDGPRAPLRLVFPAALASRWMPGLFPERP
jgi:hypothetical protein